MSDWMWTTYVRTGRVVHFQHPFQMNLALCGGALDSCSTYPPTPTTEPVDCDWCLAIAVGAPATPELADAMRKAMVPLSPFVSVSRATDIGP